MILTNFPDAMSQPEMQGFLLKKSQSGAPSTLQSGCRTSDPVLLSHGKESVKHRFSFNKLLGLEQKRFLVLQVVVHCAQGEKK